MIVPIYNDKPSTKILSATLPPLYFWFLHAAIIFASLLTTGARGVGAPSSVVALSILRPESTSHSCQFASSVLALGGQGSNKSVHCYVLCWPSEVPGTVYSQYSLLNEWLELLSYVNSSDWWAGFHQTSAEGTMGFKEVQRYRNTPLQVCIASSARPIMSLNGEREGWSAEGRGEFRE